MEIKFSAATPALENRNYVSSTRVAALPDPLREDARARAGTNTETGI